MRCDLLLLIAICSCSCQTASDKHDTPPELASSFTPPEEAKLTADARLEDAAAAVLFTLQNLVFVDANTMSEDRRKSLINWVALLRHAFPKPENRASLSALLQTIKRRQVWDEGAWTKSLARWTFASYGPGDSVPRWNSCLVPV